MKITVQLVIEPEDGPAVVTEVATLARETLTDETLGLSLAEGNRILAQLQEAVVVQQAAAYIAKQQTCPQCGARRRCKRQHHSVIRSLFGKLRLSSPRLYTCGCQPADTPRSSSPLANLFPERTTPELRYIEAKWAALLPYGVTVDVLEEVLPLRANRATVYRHTQQVAERLEGELGDEQPLKSRGFCISPPKGAFYEIRWRRVRNRVAAPALSLQAIGSESVSERPFRDGAPRCLNIRLRTAFLHHLRRSELPRCWLMAGNDADWVSGLANRGAILTLLHRFGGTCNPPVPLLHVAQLDRFLTRPSSVLDSRFARLSAGSTDAPLARLKSCESGYPTESGDLHSPSVAAQVAAQSISHEDESD
jgi:hypothetical protein